VLEAIQLPGGGRRETGLAIAISRKGVWRTDPGFHGTKEFNWLTAHAQDYGFILRYPQGKEQFTGVSYEPWHWRYVGVEAAQKIRASGQCLEEYLGIG
jgi:D-alanyl-D-alanine carboxypeptidase